MSNFSFLKTEYSELFPGAKQVEELALSDPRGSCFYARLTLEHTVEWLYDHDRSLQRPYENRLGAMIHERTFQQLLPPPLFAKVKAIQRAGNQAAHSQREIRSVDSVRICKELFHVLYWVARTYTRLSNPKELDVAFDPELLKPKKKVKVVVSSTASLKKKEEANEKERQAFDAAIAEREAAIKAQARTLEEREAVLAQMDANLARLRCELAEAKGRNIKVPDSHDYTEQETRKLIIDQLLVEAGWRIGADVFEEYPVTGMPNTRGEGFVDYLLWGADGLPVAVVEAKKTSVDPHVGQQQAKLYADCIESMHGRRPIIFFTNGYETWIWDDHTYPSRMIQGFYTQDQLQLLIERRSSRQSLQGQDVNKKIVDRYYQIRVIQSLGESFMQAQRKGLLAMATGTGKTRTVIALVDLLMRRGWVKRVLFLADRVALVNQAVNAFKTYLPETSPVNLVTEKDKTGRVYVCTYPTMMGLIDQMTDGYRPYGVGHFDLIVIDEAHRSVYQKYGAIFDYFDALLVGLTATPRDEVHHDTYHLFDLETGIPTDTYGLQEAVDDGYLVPPKAISVPLKFQREGIKYDDLSEEEKEHWEDLDWGDDETPDAVDASAVNKWLFNEDTVDKVLKHLMENGLKVEGGDTLGKTIVFAKNHEHALFIEKRFNIHYPHLKGHFARVIDNYATYAQSLIDDFSTPSKYPQIAISVDMLDTGIDVPEVVNLVFFKIVRSRTKFYQMIGRGTRLCPDLYGPGEDKDSFVIFDFCGNLEYFGENPEGVEGSDAVPLSKRLFLNRLQLIEELQGPTGQGSDKEALRELANEVRDILHQEVFAMNIDNFIVRPQRQYVERFQKRENWDHLSGEAMGDLVYRVAGLPSEQEKEDITAKLFDNTCLKLQLGLLDPSPAFIKLQKQVREMASDLEEKSSIPMVKAQMQLIREVQTDEYWEGITLPLLEILRKKLRNLIQFIEKKKRKIVYTILQDELWEDEVHEVPIDGIGVGIDMVRYKKKVEAFVRSHDDHIVIRKLRYNKPLTSLDLQELERFLFESSEVESRKHFEVAFGKQDSLSLFIRSLVGLDRGAAKDAFSTYLDTTRFNATQIRFIEMIIDHLTRKGTMDAGMLYEEPFTDIHYAGVDGVFEDATVGEIIGVIRTINANAEGGSVA
jgi:type I restriction enzyme R subunit